MAANFQLHLERQLRFLDRSCAAYDAGETDEAIRMATVLRVLIHNTPKSTSLLSHLGATGIKLLSTTSGAAPGTIYYWGLGTMQLTPHGARYFPSLDFGPIKQQLTVSDWWEQIVFVLDPQTQLSRKQIVLVAANKDGGAHVDAKLSPEYEALAAEGALGHFVSGEGDAAVQTPITEAHYVAIRQMAYEVLNSAELLALV